ncbi:ATP-dependent carboxylate-amine ligase [Exilibacterium tricleocarpae]|uniref:ATP-dependent carboxylate-amine ligase n=1 Tax=Exilibacterium tricleocarpae TaxID=2591008 RepID=A0A545T3G0_9GAMM|nr:ATP-grasp domain-containing protein [Exilibacterium tricleocarpae]TQV71757.1 ATP-dependent carboxylate-amine ligase [Exilibacterium tricleocarpae]
MAQRRQRILVLDANQRSALAVTRSLGRIPELAISTADSTTTALAGYSRYSENYYTHPSPQHQPEAFLSWLNDTIRAEAIDALFPTTEITSQLLLMNSDRIGHCLLPFAPYETVMSLADKGKLVKLAQSVDVPTPASRHYCRAGDVETEKVEKFPVVVKPCLSRIWTGQQWLDTAVRVARSRAELEHILTATDYLQNNEFMLQSFVPGTGAGIFALYDQGEPVAFFAHQRLREKPPQGGVSVLSASAAINPRLQEMARKLLSAVNWHGVAMIEFRMTPDGHPYLMEVNTRFWGSLQLAIDAGVDFPKLLWQITAQRPVDPVGEYRVGRRLRWLLGDIDSLYLALRSRDFTRWEKLARLIGFFIPRPFITRHEVNRLGDLRPAWAEVKAYVRALRS